MRNIPGTDYISFRKSVNHYYIVKSVMGKKRYLGSFPTLIGALMIRDWCESHNWEPYPVRRYNNNSEKYIYPTKYDENVWIISKVIDNKTIHFGTYNNLEEAIIARDYFIEHNWDIADKDKFKKIDELQYITKKSDGKFEINKWVDENGVMKQVYFGRFNTVDEAIIERNLLIKSNWDIDTLCDSIDETVNGESEWLKGVKLKTTFQKQKYRNDAYAYNRQKKYEYKQELKKYGVSSE